MGMPSLPVPQLQRWAIILSVYLYETEFHCTKDHGNADGISRLPFPSKKKSNAPTEAEVFNVTQIDSLLVTSSQLGQATSQDPLLS